jgi:hypothetical protein
MFQNKFFLISLFFIIMTLILSSLLGSFLFGVKVGLKRENPYFDKIFHLYNISKNYDFKISKIFDKAHLQKVKKNEQKKINYKTLSLENKIGIQSGNIPENLIIAATLSLLEDNKKVNHYLIFLKENKIIHKITLDETKFKKVENYHKWPHGLIIDNLEHVYYNFDSGNSLIKKDLCGNVIWQIEGKFHHLMSINENYLWVLKKENFGDYDTSENFLKVNAFDGKILDSFNTKDLIKANLPYDYFSIKQRDLSSVWDYEPFHYNDIDVLTNKFSKYFDNYNEGDLLISSRSLNSIFVVDPKNLKVKKFLFGLTRRQHDPDWNKGYVSIYDNQTEWGNTSSGEEIRYFNSRIIKMNQLDEKNLETINYKSSFISDARGNHEMLDLGKDKIFSLIISPYEGKLLLFDGKNLIYSLENNQKGEVLPISNGKIIKNNKIIDNIKRCKK